MMALSTALGVAWVMRYFSLMASSSASLKSKVKGGSVNLADYQSTFEAALNFGPQHQCSQRHFSAGFILQQQRKGGLTFVPKRAKILQMHLMQSKWRQTPTKLLELGYQFFGNCFCETIYGMGVWSQSCWSGQIPTHFLTILSIKRQESHKS